MNTNNKHVPKVFRIFDITRFPHDLARLLLTPLLLVYRTKKIHVSGKRYFNSIKGAVLLASNHVSFNDPFVISTGFWYRRVYKLVSEAVMCDPVRNFFMRGLGCIRIDRNIADIEAIRNTLAALSTGRPVVLFPQGGIKRDGNADGIKPGTVLIALQAGVPVIPMYTGKRKHWYNRSVVVVGDPIVFSDHCKKKMPSVADLEEMSEFLHARMLECKSTYERITGGKK